MMSGQCTDSQFDFQDEVNFAIKALEKEIPIKTIKTSDSYTGDKIMIFCECSSVVQNSEWSAKYYPNCGKKIKWM